MSEIPSYGRCPGCGGVLTEPLGGNVHCFVRCTACGAEYELDDPRLAGADRGGAVAEPNP